VQLYFCDCHETLEQKLLIMRPDLLLVPESEAKEVLNWIKSMNLEHEVPIIVIGSDDNTRQWTRLGIYSVWSEENWEDELQKTNTVVPLQNNNDLLPKDEGIELEEDPIIIAVGSVYSGAGSTHTALLIANYLSRTQKQKVAVWECAEHPTFQFLQYVQNGKFNNSPRFDIGKVTYLKAEVELSEVEAAAEKFRYIILDLGYIQNSPQKDLFFKSRLSVLVGSGSSWRVGEFFKFCNNYSQIKQSRWRIVLPLASSETQEEVGLMLSGRPVFALPAHSIVSEQQDDTDQMLEGILSPVLIKKTKRKFRLF
jgi:hypothetical protein